MTQLETVYVPYQEAESEFVEKRSRFIGHVWPVDSEGQAQELLRRVRKQHYDARHNCWCYLLGGSVVRYSDDGEPQGTAGQPMLAVFQREHVTNLLCVVTRYFGGILLGAGGLTRAYSKSARDALAAALLVYGLALGAGVSRTTLVLAGLAVSGMLTAGMNTIKLLYPDAIAGASDFLVGGLSGVTLSGLKGAVPYLITGTLLALLLAADLNVLCLGEQSAASLGLHIGAVRFLGILAAALLAGAAVSFAGLLSFVGLLAPHIARRLVGNNHRILLPAAMLLGAAFVVLCDVLARCLFAPFELPVGILLSLIGGPFFLGLLLHGRGRRMYD